jgi:HPt (histidine-containing phosphotransfer) domain-containing protein
MQFLILAPMKRAEADAQAFWDATAIHRHNAATQHCSEVRMTTHDVDSHHTASRVGAEAFSMTEALEHVEGDLDLLREMADLFLDEVDNMTRAIEQSITAGDPVALQHAAHTLKGSVSNFAAHAATEASFALEKMGRQQDFTHTSAALAALKSALAQLIPALTALKEKEAA